MLVKVYLDVLLTTFIEIKPILPSGYETNDVFTNERLHLAVLLMTDQKLFLSPRDVTNEVYTDEEIYINVFFHLDLLLTNIYWSVISTKCVANIFSLKYDS